MPRENICESSHQAASGVTEATHRGILSVHTGLCKTVTHTLLNIISSGYKRNVLMISAWCFNLTWNGKDDESAIAVYIFSIKLKKYLIYITSAGVLSHVQVGLHHSQINLYCYCDMAFLLVKYFLKEPRAPMFYFVYHYDSVTCVVTGILS